MVADNHYNDEALLNLLRKRMGTGEDTTLAHVESCSSCQERLETISQSGITWDEVSDLLRPSTQDGDHNPFSANDASYDDASLAFLEPSDHPESLGRFARYEIMQLLGRGGMGIVMRGFDPSLNRHSAIKVLAPELATSAAARRRFSREAKSAAAVVHAHVVPIQTVDEHNGLPYLVMPVVEGQSLQQRVNQDGPLSVIEAVRIASQVAEGLQAAHEQGLVHRDIKPANVLLENGVERVQITDFGLARAIDDASMTRSGVITGTPQYMSPEQAHGDTIDHRSDLFSLGSLIYFMLTGHSPFRAETTMGVLNRIGNDVPRSIRSSNADVPEWLERIVMKLLAKPVDDRFQTAEQVSSLLQDWYAHLQQPESVPPPQSTHAPFVSGGDSRSDVSKWLMAAGAFGVLLFGGIIITLELNKGRLTIESEVDDVPIRIMQGDKLIDRMMVSKAETSVRVAAGRYVVEIDGKFDGVKVVGKTVSLNRRGKETVKVVRVVEKTRGNPNDQQQAELSGGDNKKRLRGLVEIDINNDGMLDRYLQSSGIVGPSSDSTTVSVPDGGTVLLGGWELISIEEQGVKLNDNSFERWKRQHQHQNWTSIEIRDKTLLMIGDDIQSYDFAVDYDSGMLPLFRISRDKKTVYEGVLMSNGLVTDTRLSIAVDLWGKTRAIDFKTDGNNTVLEYRRIPKRPSVEVGKSDSRFATPESLMRRFAKCQFQDDLPGCIECYSDNLVNSLAVSYLMTAQIMAQGILESEIKGELNEESRKNLEKVKRLLERSLVSDAPAIASAGLLQATKLYAKGASSAEDMSPEESLLIASSGSLLKDPRQFIIEFFAIGSDDEDDDKPSAKRVYEIKHRGEKTFASDGPDCTGYELKHINGRWWIHSLTNEDDMDSSPDSQAADTESAEVGSQFTGSWRVLHMSDPESGGEKYVPPENIVLTFDEFTMTWVTEPEPPARCTFRQLPGDKLEFICMGLEPDDEPSKMVYDFTMTSAVDLELSGNGGPGILHLHKMADEEVHSTYVSETVPVDTKINYGWHSSEVVGTHIRLIQSDGFLEAISWPDNIRMLLRNKAGAIKEIRRDLLLKPVDDQKIEFGMHGHITTMQDRKRIVKIVANAYREKIKQTYAKASRRIVEMLREAHTEVMKEREAAEAEHRQLLLNDEEDDLKLKASVENLRRINELMSRLCDNLLEFGVPALGGSLDVSLDRAKHPVMP